jgi:preprotein translocase subunit YajC
MFEQMTWTLGQTDTVTPAPPVLPEAPQEGQSIEGQPAMPDGTTGPGTEEAAPRGGSGIWLILLMGFVLLWVFMMSGQRKEKKKRAAMLGALKKGCKVQTVGGILGTVVEVRDDEVVVKVDENANTRLRFARSAIQAVLEAPEQG